MELPTFQVVRKKDRSFDVKLTTPMGQLKTIAGFGSEHEAAAWVIQMERALHEAHPVLGPRPKHHAPGTR